MPKTDSETRRQRIELIFRHLEQNARGLTEREIEEELNLGRRNVNNYLHALEIEGKVYKDEGTTLWFALPYHQTRLRKIELTPEEAMTLYLATRLLVKQHDKRNESAEMALDKLAEALTYDVGVGHEIRQAALELAQRPGDPGYSRIFRTVMQSYIYRRKLQITYEPLSGKSFETTFSPYLLEPSAIGYATYVIGHSSIVDALRTYKLERIQSAALIPDEYSVPADFPGLDYLRSAWSIISGEDVIPVKVRFRTARAARRVRESVWHPSQEIVDDPENPAGCIWTAQIADLTDFKPWLRSWGGDVEVLEPAALQEEMKKEVKRMARVYGVGNGEVVNPQVEKLLRCWGKTQRFNDAVFHPALFHMLDVGNVARILLADPACRRWRYVLANALDAEANTLSNWLPYIIAMHDIGKLTAAFQRQNALQSQRLQAEGFTFGNWQDDMWFHHTLLGQVHIQEETVDLHLPKAWQNLWRDVVGGHHGAFESRQMLKTAHTRLMTHEPASWRELRVLASRLLSQSLLNSSMPANSPAHLARATIALTGFTILCDWLGSDERFFPPMADYDLESYQAISVDHARRAVQAAGFFQSTQSATPTGFGDLFPDKQPPRPLQVAVDAIPPAALAGPALVIVEAPTGEGKTEAALAIAHRLAQASGTDALYYALPTTATSNQMFKRVREYLDKHLSLPVDVQLIHGQAHLQEDDLEAQPLTNGKPSTDDAVAWFTSKKRAILAPFGVGTVDQAELAALNVKHVALRLVGLAGKVIIFDEVHAYDTYMTTIVGRLLEWLSALGTSVIILSATLPQKQRAVLAQAYGATLPTDHAQADAYPGLWVLPRDGKPYHAEPTAYQPDRPLAVKHLHFTDDEPETKAQWLLSAVQDGGCACWIANTVARAQAIYKALCNAPEARDVDLDLLHARFPLTGREQREKTLAEKYGPLPKAGERDARPQRGIVIGTQVLEQSLDLDFDVMVSDLAPIDLLLQRAGRLQRHARPRPAAYANRPTLWVNIPQDEQGVPDLGMDIHIYDAYLLYQTWYTLENYGEMLNLPSDYRPLVEAVYREDALVIDEKLAKPWKKLQEKQSDAIKQANERLLPEPASGRTFCRRSAQITFEEDETGASWIVAQTRLGRESVNVIPMEKLDENTVRMFPDGLPIALGQAANAKVQRQLLRHHLRVSRPEIVKALKKSVDLPPLFKRSPRLNGYYPLWLENGEAHFPKLWEEGEIVVTLDANLGLVIT